MGAGRGCVTARPLLFSRYLRVFRGCLSARSPHPVANSGYSWGMETARQEGKMAVNPAILEEIKRRVERELGRGYCRDLAFKNVSRFGPRANTYVFEDGRGTRLCYTEDGYGYAIDVKGAGGEINYSAYEPYMVTYEGRYVGPRTHLTNDTCA